MFNKKYEERLVEWRNFRDTLENENDPLQVAIDFYKNAPRTSISVDPYAQSTWLDPWELLQENLYCDFSILLAILYTLQLTERFSQSHFEIHILHDNENSETHYVLYVDDRVIGYDPDIHISKSDLPKSVCSHHEYQFSEHQ